jgi:hypothetical protein
MCLYVFIYFKGFVYDLIWMIYINQAAGIIIDVHYEVDMFHGGAL